MDDSQRDKGSQKRPGPANHTRTSAPSGKRRQGKPAADDRPKRPLSAYNLFFRDQKELLTAEQKKKGGPSDLFESMAKTIGKRWQAISPEEYEAYTAQADADSARYREEMELYNLRKATMYDRGADDQGSDKDVASTPLPSSAKPPPSVMTTAVDDRLSSLPEARGESITSASQPASLFLNMPGIDSLLMLQKGHQLLIVPGPMELLMLQNQQLWQQQQYLQYQLLQQQLLLQSGRQGSMQWEGLPNAAWPQMPPPAVPSVAHQPLTSAPADLTELTHEVSVSSGENDKEKNGVNEKTGHDDIVGS